MAIPKSTRSFVMNALRRATYKYPNRFNAMKKSHVGRNQYLCAGCGKIFTKKEVQQDHIIPVMPIEGTEDFNILIERMFCEESGWQTLCSKGEESCHAKKTAAENALRREAKKPTKKAKKK